MFDSLIEFGQCVAINLTFAGAEDKTVAAVPAGQKWVVTYMHLECSATVDLIVKSGATEITGALAMTATAVYDIESSGAPVLKATATGDDLIIRASGACDVDGWVYYALVSK